MTEPPEPRRPEEGGGDEPHEWTPEEAREFVQEHTPDMQEAIDAARDEMGEEAFEAAVAEVLRRANRPRPDDWDPTHVPTEDEYLEEGDVEPDDFFDTDWGQIDRDNELSDLVGGGGNVEISEESVRGEQEAADYIADARDEIRGTPLPEKTSPEAVMAEYERRKREAAEPPAPRAPTQEGSAVPMGLQESIGTLEHVAGNTASSGPLSEVSVLLSGTVLPAAQQAVEQLAELANAARGATEGNANASGEVSSTSEHAAGAIEEVIDALNQAIEAVGRAVEHEQVFRRTCSDVATRLQS